MNFENGFPNSSNFQTAPTSELRLEIRNFKTLVANES